MLGSIFRNNEKVFKRTSVGKSEGNTAQQMLVTCEKINSSGSIEPNFPRFTDQFSLRCEISCIYCSGIVFKTISLTIKPRVFGSFAVRKLCSNKAFMRKITIGIWDFEPISREGTVREKGIQGVVYEERWIGHSRISVVVSQISSIWLRYFASYFQINFLQVNKIITVTGDFKFKHWSIGWIDRSNFLIKSVFKSNQKRLFFKQIQRAMGSFIG